MKKLILTVLFIPALITLTGCVSRESGNGTPAEAELATYANDKMFLFEDFKFYLRGVYAQVEVIEGKKTGEGMRLEYYVQLDGPQSAEKDRRRELHVIEGDKAFYEEISRLLETHEAMKWNGFYGQNPPGVLDGKSGGFEAKLSDGRVVSAYGSNNFPKGFLSLWNTLRDKLKK